MEHVNRSERERKSVKDLPVWLRTGPPDNEWVPDEDAYYDWQIRKAERTEWIETLEAKLPFPFPPSFRSLVSRYVYPGFLIGPLAPC